MVEAYKITPSFLQAVSMAINVLDVTLRLVRTSGQKKGQCAVKHAGQLTRQHGSSCIKEASRHFNVFREPTFLWG